MATIEIAGGDRDCSSAVISAYQAAGLDVEATYTGNMLDAFLATGKFEKWSCYNSVAQRGDIYLNYSDHTAMCVDDGTGSYGYDALAEFSISENGTIYGEVGDQTGSESHICGFYDFPWNCTLHCTDRELAERAAQVMEHLCTCPNHGYTQGGGRWGDGTFEYIDVSGEGAATDNPVYTGNVLYKLHTLGGGWLPWMCGLVDEGGSGDDFAGEAYASHDGLMVDNGITYRVHTVGGGWLPWVSGCDENDGENGMAGIYGQAIDGIQVQGNVSYRVQTASREGWLPWVTGCGDGDDGYAGIYGEAIDKLQMVWA